MYSPKSASLSIEEYLLSIQDLDKRFHVHNWLNGLTPMFEYIRMRDYVKVENLPAIKIKDDDAVDAQGSSYLIYINKGLIDYCYNLKYDYSICIDDPCIETIRDTPGFIESISFKWMMAHEFYHGARAHNDKVTAELAKGKHSQISLDRGAEYDADLIALAHIHRYIKGFLVHLKDIGAWDEVPSDLTSRKITLCVIFSAIRGLHENEQVSASHPSIASRLYSIITKLGSMGVEESDPPDVTFELEETKDRVLTLAACFVKCEKLFQEINGANSGDLLHEVAELLVDPDFSHIAAWDDMKNKPYDS